LKDYLGANDGMLRDLNFYEKSKFIRIEVVMKRTSLVCCALTLLLTSLGAARSANAVGLLGFGSPPTTFTNSAGAVITVPGLPAWFQDQNGVAVRPCLDAVPCALVARAPGSLGLLDPGFNPALPLAYPSNFPDEAFYFGAVATFPVGTSTAQISMTQEFIFLDNPDPALGKPTFPGAPVAVPAPFQRLRFAYTFNGLGGAGVPPPAAVAPGTSFKLTTPWGDTTFNLQDALNNPATNTKCERALAVADTRCLFTRDTFANTLPAPPDFAPALAGAILPTDFGGSPMSTFLQDPAAVPGFLGSAAAAPLSFTGAPTGRANLFSVTDPMGNTASTTALKSLTGKKFGMDVAPLAFDFGAAVPVTTPVTTSPATTITVTNPDTVSALTLGTLALSGTNPADFTITADTCSTVTLPAAPAGAPPSTCTFAVAFAPKRLAPAPEAPIRTAMVSIQGTFAGAAAPPRLAALSGTALLVPRITVTDSIAPTTDQQVSFGGVLVGASADATITTTNTGSADLAIGQIASADPLATPFSILNDACSGKTIAPDATCTLTLRFAPTASATASDTFDIPGTGLPTVTVSVNGTGGTSITTNGTVNNPPANPVLVSPTNGQTGLPSTMTFTWKKSADPDSDVVKYHFSYSTDQNFTGAQTVDVASAKAAGLLFASLGSMSGGIILFGFISGSGMKRSRKLLFVIPVLLLTGALFTACGSGGGTPGTTALPPGSTAADLASTTVTGLAANTTYYWRVVADDGKGGLASSETFSFKTQ
jgi:Purple acid Phosphatase, N-terminal domain/Abnormal spindle-like microcephaly-assoc'd, ASPM-SPD-2-Hydin